MWIQIDEDKLGGPTVADSGVLSYLMGRIDLHRHLETEQAKSFRAIALRYHTREGELEFDDDAAVSIDPDGNDGAYVQAWVWVAGNFCRRCNDAYEFCPGCADYLDYRELCARPDTERPAPLACRASR